MIAILWVKVLIFQGAKPIFNVGSLSHKNCLNGASHRIVTVFLAVFYFHLLGEKIYI